MTVVLIQIQEFLERVRKGSELAREFIALVV